MIIKEIYDVFGSNLPATRSAYSAKDAKPVTMLTITKEFKTWKNFVLEYNKYAIAQRNSAPKTIEKATMKYQKPEPSKAKQIVKGK